MQRVAPRHALGKSSPAGIAWAGVGAAMPRNSGHRNKLFEAFRLQAYGWERGWHCSRR